MDNYLQQQWKEKEWMEKMEKEVTIFNNAADNALAARTKIEPFNASFINLLNSNVNNKPIRQIISL
ncbi:hypothetical protein [Spiroplasma endosymbiont of Polydrusus pterygomalis]|uniref:hypothetical protein n=1 Tax=Spiroplasma endosymbiont of Polydrusus pterygomalis TaxID=3139327 RepID=UPI003CCB037F